MCKAKQCRRINSNPLNIFGVYLYKNIDVKGTNFRTPLHQHSEKRIRLVMK